jgi:nucleoside-diphosphate-sugar epimerase
MMLSGKVLVIGRTGQVAYELHRGVWPPKFSVDYVDREQLDLARPEDARAAVIQRRPQIVVNAAAYTAVDAAENDRDMAFAINRDGPAALADACREVSAALVHYSTTMSMTARKSALMSRTTRSTRSRSTAQARRRATLPSERYSTATSSSGHHGCTARGGTIS